MISPTDVQDAASRLERENLRFRTFLKNRAGEDALDRDFASLHKELFSEEFCIQCGNCCREYSTVLKDSDIDAIAKHLEVTPSAFLSKYTVDSPDGPEIKAPCCFLSSDGRCEINACKPEECRAFPYTDRPERLWSLYNGERPLRSSPVLVRHPFPQEPDHLHHQLPHGVVQASHLAFPGKKGPLSGMIRIAVI